VQRSAHARRCAVKQAGSARAPVRYAAPPAVLRATRQRESGNTCRQSCDDDRQAGAVGSARAAAEAAGASRRCFVCATFCRCSAAAPCRIPPVAQRHYSDSRCKMRCVHRCAPERRRDTRAARYAAKISEKYVCRRILMSRDYSYAHEPSHLSKQPRDARHAIQAAGSRVAARVAADAVSSSLAASAFSPPRRFRRALPDEFARPPARRRAVLLQRAYKDMAPGRPMALREEWCGAVQRKAAEAPAAMPASERDTPF